MLTYVNRKVDCKKVDRKKVDRKKVDRKKVDLLTVNRWFIPLAKLLTYLVKLHTVILRLLADLENMPRL